MTSYNDITGKAMKTKGATDPYREGWDRIFSSKKTVSEIVAELPKERQDVISTAAAEKVDDMEVYHLRSYGDVSKKDLDAYLARTLPTPGAEG